MTSYSVMRTYETRDEVNGDKIEMNAYALVGEDGVIGQEVEWVDVKIYELKRKKKNHNGFGSDFNENYLGSARLTPAMMESILHG